MQIHSISNFIYIKQTFLFSINTGHLLMLYQTFIYLCDLTVLNRHNTSQKLLFVRLCPWLEVNINCTFKYLR